LIGQVVEYADKGRSIRSQVCSRDSKCDQLTWFDLILIRNDGYREICNSLRDGRLDIAPSKDSRTEIERAPVEYVFS